MVVLTALSAKADTITCTPAVIDSVYIVKLRDYADWTDTQLRPYAATLCRLESERAQLQTDVSNKAASIRATNWRVCNEVLPGPGGNDGPACKTAYGNQLNGLIDQCRAIMNIGHNPHNIGIILDETKIEVACLRGIRDALLITN